MKTKGNIDLVGSLCSCNDTLVLVVSKHIQNISNTKKVNKESYYVLFPQGGIDTVSKESLKVVC